MKPPFKIIMDDGDAWIVDDENDCVVATMRTGWNYLSVFKDGELMSILCDALNEKFNQTTKCND